MSASGDAILIRTIRQLGKRDQGDVSDDTDTEDVEKFDSLSTFSTDYVLESVAKLINAIEADQPPFAQIRPPPSMSARYNMSSKLVEHIIRLGHPSGDELGYQTLLYGNEKDLRNVFMFLIDKLPKDKEVAQHSIKDRKGILKGRIKSDLSRQLSTQWTPSIVYPSGLRPNQDGSFSRQGVSGCDEFCSCDLCFADTGTKSLAKETRGAIFNIPNSYLQTPSQICSSIIKYNESLKIIDGGFRHSAKDETLVTEIANYLLSSKENESMLTAATANHSALLPTLESFSPLKMSSAKPEVEIEAEEKTDRALNELKAKRDVAEIELTQIQDTYKLLRNETMLLRKEIAQEKLDEVQLHKELTELSDHVRRREQVMTLLPDGEANLQKLQAIVMRSKEKLRSLKIQWEEHRNSLEQEHADLTAKIEATKSVGQVMDNTTKLKVSIANAESETNRKEALVEKYSIEVGKLKKSVPRSVYTRQILDILNNITKQRQETAKIIDDIKSTQKDINLLDGKLYRTYIEADEKIFQMAKSDSVMVPVYRSLTDLHKESSTIIELVRQISQVKRSTRSIQDQIQSEKSKKLKDRMEAVKLDLDKIRSENKLLKEKIRGTK